MDKDLFGDNIPKDKKKVEGVEKIIYFAKINCPNYEQFNFDGSRKITLNEIIKSSFDKNNEYYRSGDKSKGFFYKYKKNNYVMSVLEMTNNYCFGKLYTEKIHNDILEEYKIEDKEHSYSNDNNIKSIIIKSFTFFYIDFKKNSLAYIGNKNLRKIKDIFQNYFHDCTCEDVSISFYGDLDILSKINKSNKLESIEFELIPNGEIIKSIDKCLGFDRDIESYILDMKIKKPTKSYLTQFVSDNNLVKKIKHPRLKLQDEFLNENISYLFERYFTIKESIRIDDIELVKFAKVKDKLIIALKKYIYKEV